MIKNPIISIDWDHTFRNMHGLDLNIFSLVCYAKAKNITIGLTTHRDIENTTLYSLYYWQFKKPENIKTPLAAAINYWQKYFLDTFNVKFDFINARYQPNYQNENYYDKFLLPHELNLSFEIRHKNILDDSKKVKNIITQYQHKEAIIDNNDFKGAQLNWLAEHYKNNFNGTIYHIDDSHDVCHFLLDEFKKVNADHNVKINTIFYDKATMFYNDHCAMFLREIGLLSDLENFLQNGCVPCSNNHFLYLSHCLLATQMCYTDTNILNKIEIYLSNLALYDNESNKLCSLIQNIIGKIKETGQPIHFFLNEWVELENQVIIPGGE
jgi:hypothetical protein